MSSTTAPRAVGTGSTTKLIVIAVPTIDSPQITVTVATSRGHRLRVTRRQVVKVRNTPRATERRRKLPRARIKRYGVRQHAKRGG